MLKSLKKSPQNLDIEIYFLAGFLHCTLETRWLGGSFFMVYRNNAGRLGSGLHQCVLRNSLAGSKQRFLCALVSDDSPSARQEHARWSGDIRATRHGAASKALRRAIARAICPQGLVSMKLK